MLYSYDLCSTDFEESQLKNKERRNKLIKNAKPTLFDVPNPLAKLTPLRSLKIRKCRKEFSDVLSNSVEPLPDIPWKKAKKKGTSNENKVMEKNQQKYSGKWLKN